MNEHQLRTHFEVLLLRRESGFFSKTVKFPDNRIKATSNSFKTHPLFHVMQWFEMFQFLDV